MWKKVLLGLIAVLAIGFWWALLDAGAAKSGEGEFDVEAYRSLIAASEGEKPQALKMQVIGTDIMPGMVAEAGNFSRDWELDFTSFQIAWPERFIAIGGAVDEATTKEMSQAGKWAFFPEKYDQLTASLSQAEQIWITHEHLDHVMAIARHPDPATIVPQLKLTRHQLDELPVHAVGGKLDPAFGNVVPFTLDMPALIAPGVVVDKTPGHTPGTLSFFVTLENGQEYFLVGDIVWIYSNVENLKTRPRLVNFMGLNEDRAAIKRQVRALSDMSKNYPDITIVPSHDRPYLDKLVQDGKIIRGF